MVSWLDFRGWKVEHIRMYMYMESKTCHISEFRVSNSSPWRGSYKLEQETKNIHMCSAQHVYINSWNTKEIPVWLQWVKIIKWGLYRAHCVGYVSVCSRNKAVYSYCSSRCVYFHPLVTSLQQAHTSDVNVNSVCMYISSTDCASVHACTNVAGLASSTRPKNVLHSLS